MNTTVLLTLEPRVSIQSIY